MSRWAVGGGCASRMRPRGPARRTHAPYACTARRRRAVGCCRNPMCPSVGVIPSCAGSQPHRQALQGRESQTGGAVPSSRSLTWSMSKWGETPGSCPIPTPASLPLLPPTPAHHPAPARRSALRERSSRDTTTAAGKEALLWFGESKAQGHGVKAGSAGDGRSPGKSAGAAKAQVRGIRDRDTRPRCGGYATAVEWIRDRVPLVQPTPDSRRDK